MTIIILYTSKCKRILKILRARERENTIMDPSCNYSSEIDESILAMKWVTATVAPRALRAAIELNLLDLMKTAGPVSATELAAQIRAPNPGAHLVIDRILCVLAANGIIECDRPQGGSDRLYSLTPTSNMFTKNDEGVSLAPLLLLNQDKVFAEALYVLIFCLIYLFMNR